MGPLTERLFCTQSERPIPQTNDQEHTKVVTYLLNAAVSYAKWAQPLKIRLRIDTVSSPLITRVASTVLFGAL